MTGSEIAFPPLIAIAQNTRQAARQLSILSTQAKNQALEAIAQAIEARSSEILAANIADCKAAEIAGIPKALYARLKLDETKLKGAIAGVRDLGKLPDPVGVVQLHRQMDEGLILKRVTCPLGVLGVIFEARPDAVVQIATLAIKSGNGVILKGGQEAAHSNEALVNAIHQGLTNCRNVVSNISTINPDVVQLLKTREETLALLQLDEYVDLIIPRGSNSFVRFVQDHTRIPVLGHAEGICHVYVDEAADIHKALAIAVDAKTQYPAACNAMETMLVHAHIASKFLPQVASALQERNVELRGDEQTCQIIDVLSATEVDWATEYSDLILAIKIVDSLEEAIAHINTYGSGHTDAIVTENPDTAATFLAQVDAAGVFHNCSTRFADGCRYGFGAEVGISTQKMPPRGPVGLEGLVTYKYQITGDGHIAATYTGTDAKAFNHKDL